jgi:hypothetical protein
LAAMFESFVEQVNSLAINGLNRQFLDEPAKRPKAEDALNELKAIRVQVGNSP